MSMTNPVVQQILQQVNMMDNGAEIKRLLLLKLEAESAGQRFGNLREIIPQEPTDVEEIITG